MGLLWDLANQAGEIETGYGYDPYDDELLLVDRQECDPIISGNKKLFNDGDGYTPSREWRRAACIPNVILEKWHREEGIRWWDSEDSAKLLAKLDDPEWRFLRTAPGRLSRKPVREFYRRSTV